MRGSAGGRSLAVSPGAAGARRGARWWEGGPSGLGADVSASGAVAYTLGCMGDGSTHVSAFSRYSSLVADGPVGGLLFEHQRCEIEFAAFPLDLAAGPTTLVPESAHACSDDSRCGYSSSTDTNVAVKFWLLKCL